MPKTTGSRSAAAGRRHNPLADDIHSAGHLRTQPSTKSKRRGRTEEDDAESGEKFVDARLSRKILQIGQELVEEDEEHERLNSRADAAAGTRSAFNFDSRFDEQEVVSDDEEDGLEDDQWADEEEGEQLGEDAVRQTRVEGSWSQEEWCLLTENVGSGPQRFGCV